jgi:ATP-dependent Clp protease protease subunit
MTTENNNNTTNQETKPKADTKNREFFLRGKVEDSNVKAIYESILDINKHDAEQEELDANYVRKPIKLSIETYGGNVYEGMGLVGVIDTSETPVHTYCYGRTMSMGFLLFAMGHKRFASRTATFMYHDGATALGGKIKDVEENLAQHKNLIKQYDEYIVEITKLTKRQLDNAKRRKQDWYLTAKQALEFGVADEILTSKRNK